MIQIPFFFISLILKETNPFYGKLFFVKKFEVKAKGKVKSRQTVRSPPHLYTSLWVHHLVRKVFGWTRVHRPRENANSLKECWRRLRTVH